MKLLLKALIIITLTVLFIGWWIDADAHSLGGDSAYCPMCQQMMPIDHLNVRVGMGFMGEFKGRYVMTLLGLWLMQFDDDKPLDISSIPDQLKVYFPPKYFTNRYVRAHWNDRLHKTRYRELWHGN